MSARNRILGRVRSAIALRDRTGHPGDFGGWRPDAPTGTPVDGFEALFRAAGGEVVRVPDRATAATWIEEFSRDYTSVAIGATVPAELAPGVPRAAPEQAQLAISMARAGVAETGSLMMDSRDGRRRQLLAPTHVVVVSAGSIQATLLDALASARDDLPSAIGFHSGPSKSADIGQIMVKGVHGPGRIVALVEGA
jgi:L-lactate dehydrogenase complex protein LldG